MCLLLYIILTTTVLLLNLKDVILFLQSVFYVYISIIFAVHFACVLRALIISI